MINKSFKILCISFLQYALATLFIGFVIYEIALICRIYLFVSCFIPSDSMQPTMLKGDYVYVTQRIPGRRILMSDSDNSLRYTVVRKKGKRGIRHNDVLLFNSPNGDALFLNNSSHFIKRCIAVPGDTFYIDNGIYKIINKKDTLGYYQYQMQLSLMSDTLFSKVIYNCFPHDSMFNWNIKNFGPLYVPKQSDNLALDCKNIRLYKNLIEYETGKEISIFNDSIFLNGSPVMAYTFTKNYYFMAGDYLFDSGDSRYWGLLPEDHIIGKALFIWKSKDPLTDKYRFGRLFQKII